MNSRLPVYFGPRAIFLVRACGQISSFRIADTSRMCAVPVQKKSVYLIVAARRRFRAFIGRDRNGNFSPRIYGKSCSVAKKIYMERLQLLNSEREVRTDETGERSLQIFISAIQ